MLPWKKENQTVTAWNRLYDQQDSQSVPPSPRADGVCDVHFSIAWTSFTHKSRRQPVPVCGGGEA